MYFYYVSFLFFFFFLSIPLLPFFAVRRPHLYYFYLFKVYIEYTHACVLRTLGSR